MFKQRPAYLAVIALLTTSLALVFTTGCNRDPNVRKQKYLESGKRYEASGKYKEAVIQFSNALKQDKSFAPAHFELAKTYLKLDSAMSAYSELLRTVDLDPSNIEARITLGNMLLGGRAYARATEQANAVLAHNPNDADAYGLLASIAQRQGDSAAALTNIQKAISLDPNRSNFHSALAVLESATPSEEPSAEQELRKAASLDAKSPTPHLLLAALLEKKGDLQGANQELHAGIAAAPDDLKAREGLAALYMRSGDNGKAEQTLLQAINDLPNNEGAAGMLASFYARTGQADRAESEFADLNSKYPKSFAIKLTYGRILFDKRDYNKLTPIAGQLTKTDAGNPQVQTLNAMLLLYTGKVDDAYALLKKSATDNPANPQIQLLLAGVELSKGDVSSAEANYRQADKLLPGSIEAASGLAQIAIDRNDAAMLSQVAEKMIQARPDYANAYLWRGMAETSRKDYDKADADFQTVLKHDPNSSAAYLQLAQLRIAQGKAPEAKALLQTALDKDPNSNRALGLLMTYDLQAKQPAKALARVQAQIAKEPANAAFYVEMARLQLQTKDFNGALASSQKAMQLVPGSSEAVQAYGEAEVALGNIDPAISVWQNWETTHPKDIHAIDILGSLEESKGEDQKAMGEYKKSLEVDSSDPIASNNLAYLMVENGQDVDVALSMAQTARQKMPTSPQTADTLAWIYYYKGNYGASREMLESALKTYPDDASMNFHLGMVYSKLNDKPNAVLHLKKAASLGPTTKAGKDASAELAKLG
jgi:tetratricopeptide (TPR) repeat protein